MKIQLRTMSDAQVESVIRQAGLTDAGPTGDEEGRAWYEGVEIRGALCDWDVANGDEIIIRGAFAQRQ